MHNLQVMASKHTDTWRDHFSGNVPNHKDISSVKYHIFYGFIYTSDRLWENLGLWESIVLNENLLYCFPKN